MTNNLKILAVMAHPDDESMGTGGILAKYAAEGLDTHLVTATRGERGWFGPPDENPGPVELGKIREKELGEAAEVLGLKDHTFFDYWDGDLDEADSTEVVAKVVDQVRRIQPDVVVTFDPNGLYGHPDHIAISQAATAALVAAADPTFKGNRDLPAHRVSKLYYMVETSESEEVYEKAFGDLVMNIDGVERRPVGWKEWAITTRIDTSAHWKQVWEAVSRHHTQLPAYKTLINLPEEYHQQLWSTGSYYRAFSLVNGGRSKEDDMFAGIR